MPMRRFRQGMMVASLVLALSPAVPASALDSAYTTLDLDACSVLETHEESGGVLLECEGWNGIAVFVSEGDLRFDVDFGMPDGNWNSFGPFNSPHDTIEWRVAGDTAHAAVLRFFLDTGITGTDEDKSQMLAVYKVARDDTPGCIIGAVDAAVEQPNGVARGMAALSSTFECGTDFPITVGPIGSHVTSLSGSVPE